MRDGVAKPTEQPVSATLREQVARAIYGAAYSGYAERGLRVPSPGWCWEKAGEEQQQFAFRQADAAIAVMLNWKP